jgi:anti-sigma-K factor RskA
MSVRFAGSTHDGPIAHHESAVAMVSEHIDADTLAAYAVDALEADEVLAIGPHLAQCERCRRELASLREVTSTLPYGLSVAEPPPDLRERIIARAQGDHQPVTPPLVSGVARRGWSSWLSRLTPAFALVTLLLGFLLGQIYPQRATADLATQPGARQGTVQGIGQGMVIVVPAGGQLQLQLADLPPLGSEQVYQLWFLGADSPISGGTFTVDANGNARLEISGLHWAPSYSGIAITREPPGGSPGPTSDIVAQASL